MPPSATPAATSASAGRPAPTTRGDAELLREGLEALGDERAAACAADDLPARLPAGLHRRREEWPAWCARAERAGAAARRSRGEILAAPRARLAFPRSPDPRRVLDHFEGFVDLLDLAGECGREDLLFRLCRRLSPAIRWPGDSRNASGRWCGRRRSRGRLGSPRFAWEVDLNRGMRLLDRGDREGGEALVRRAGSVVRRLRPEIQIAVEAVGLLDRRMDLRRRNRTVSQRLRSLRASDPDRLHAGLHRDGDGPRRRRRRPPGSACGG